MALPAMQSVFVDEYLKDLNGSQAYIRAGYKARGNSAEVNASRLLRNAKVQAAIAERMKAREQRTEITQDRVLKEFARLAFFDPRKLLNDDGTPKPINELDDDTAAAISGLDIEEANENRGVVRKYKIADKKGALDSVARHLGMFNDKLNVTHSFSEMTDEELLAEMAMHGVLPNGGKP